jgi:hypothetical protein
MASMNLTPIITNEAEPYVSSQDSDSIQFSTSNDTVSSYNMLPMPMEGAHFGDNLRCATINSCGSGEHFAKVEIIVDFAADESLDIVIVTELKTTLARTRN